ncbi:MAG TPA: hypothetical protein VK540_31690, partial [Polyangiaceae bacterium]|nr:hypothetical protein [Polyangiaceae bacterium]
MVAKKTCTRCGSSKPLSAFGQQRGAPRAACKPCEADRTRLYRERGGAVGRVADAGGMSHLKIGRLLGIPKSTVQVIERRAIRK